MNARDSASDEQSSDDAEHDADKTQVDSVDDHDLKGPGAVDTLHAVEFDVRGRGRSGDARQWPARVTDEMVKHGDRLGNEFDDPIRGHDTDVHVRDERERAATLRRTAREHDRSRLSNRDLARGDDTVEQVELVRRELRVFDELELLRQPLGRKPRRNAEPLHATPYADLRYGCAHAAGMGALDGCLVCGDALFEEPAEFGAGPCADPAIAALDDGSTGRARCQRAPNAVENLLPAHRERHHSRNVCSGMAGRSRACIQAWSGPGSRAAAERTRPRRIVRKRRWARS